MLMETAASKFWLSVIAKRHFQNGRLARRLALPCELGGERLLLNRAFFNFRKSFLALGLSRAIPIFPAAAPSGAADWPLAQPESFFFTHDGVCPTLTPWLRWNQINFSAISRRPTWIGCAK